MYINVFISVTSLMCVREAQGVQQFMQNQTNRPKTNKLHIFGLETHHQNENKNLI